MAAMKIFIFEHVTGGGLAGQDIPASLAAQGAAMLQAVAADFLAAGCSVQTTFDTRLTVPLGVAEVKPITRPAQLFPAFDSLAAQADAVLVIAPETAGVLEQWEARLRQRGIRSLGCEPEAVHLCSDKLALALHLQQRGVPTPATFDAREVMQHVAGLTFPCVLKPRDGAGCEHTFVCPDAAVLAHRLAEAGAAAGAFVVQPWIPGLACSACVLVQKEGLLPLRGGQQHISRGSGGELGYAGGCVPLAPDFERRALALASKAIAAVPGLAGFVGVDLVLGSEPAQDQVIEINPRVTMSYIALRELCKRNIAEAWLGRRKKLPWRSGQAAFDSAGSITQYPAVSSAVR